MFHSTFFPVGSFQLVKADQRFKEICKFHLKSSIKDSVALETYFYKLYVSGHDFLRDKLSVGISVKLLRKVILFPKKCLRDFCLRELILFANKCLRDLCLREFILFAYKSLRDLCLKELLLFAKICLRVFCLRDFCLRDCCLRDFCPRKLIFFANKYLREYMSKVSGNKSQKSQEMNVKSLRDFISCQ